MFKLSEVFEIAGGIGLYDYAQSKLRKMSPARTALLQIIFWSAVVILFLVWLTWFILELMLEALSFLAQRIWIIIIPAIIIILVFFTP